MSRRIWLHGVLCALVVPSWAVLTSRTPLTAMPSTPAEPTAVATQAMDAPVVEARRMLEPAVRDPFAPPATAAIVVPPAAPAPPAPQMAAPPPPEPPAPPALNLRFTGRMLAPDGSLAVFAQFKEETMTLVVGTELPNGYRVLAITERAVELVYPPLQSTGRLDLPPPPAFEVR